MLARPLLVLLISAGFVATLRAQEPPAGAKPPLPIRGLAFSPDGSFLAVSAGDSQSLAGRLTLYGAVDRQVRATRDETTGITAVAYAPDGKSLAIGTFGGSARRLDVGTLDARHNFEGHAGQISSVSISADGKLLASAGADSKIRLWSYTSGELVRVLEGHTRPVSCVAFAPDGGRLASSSGDRTTRIWDVAKGEIQHVLEASESAIPHVAFSADGRYLMTCHYDASVRIRDAATTELVARIETVAQRSCFSPDGKMLAVGTFQQDAGDVRLYDLHLGEPPEDLHRKIDELIGRWNEDDFALREAASRELVAVGMAAGAQLRAATRSESAEMRMRARLANERVGSPAPRKVLAAGGPVSPVVFSPDGRLLAAGDRTGQVILWNAVTGEREATLPPR